MRPCQEDGLECVYEDQPHLEPITYSIGTFALKHGERDDEDPENPEHCLCGHPNYQTCNGAGVLDLTVQKVDGKVEVS